MFSNTLFYLEILVLIISELHPLHLSKQIYCFPNRNPSTGCSGTRYFLVLLSFFQYKSLKFYSKQPRLGLISVGCCCSGKKRERERGRQKSMSVCSITGQKRREHVCKQQVGLSIWKAIRASVVCLEGQSWETDTSAREKTEKMLSFIFIFAHIQRNFSYSHLYYDPEIKQHTTRLCFHSWGSTWSCFCIFLKLNFITSFFSPT